MNSTDPHRELNYLWSTLQSLGATEMEDVQRAYVTVREALNALHERPDVRESVAAELEREAEARHEDYAEYEAEYGIKARHDDGCSMCGVASAARFLRGGER